MTWPPPEELKRVVRRQVDAILEPRAEAGRALQKALREVRDLIDERLRSTSIGNRAEATEQSDARAEGMSYARTAALAILDHEIEYGRIAAALVDVERGGAAEAMFHAGTAAGERVGRAKALAAIEALVPERIEHPDEWTVTIAEVRRALRQPARLAAEPAPSVAAE